MQAVPAAGRPAVDQTDDDLRHEPDQPLHLEDVQPPGARRIDRLGRLARCVLIAAATADALVATGAERPPAVLRAGSVAGQQDDADLGPHPCMVEHAVELVDAVRAERVANLGPVERHPHRRLRFPVDDMTVIGDVGQLESVDRLPHRRVKRVVGHGLTVFAFGRVAGNHPDNPDNYDHDRHEGLRVDRDPYTVGIAPGDGLVVRTGDVVMYIADTSLSTGSLIMAVESVANAEQPGGAIAERLAALAFGTDSASVAPFGVLAPTANGVLVLLRGNVIAQIDTADGVRELSGARALTWVDEVLPPSARRVTIGGRPGLVAAQTLRSAGRCRARRGICARTVSLCNAAIDRTQRRRGRNHPPPDSTRSTDHRTAGGPSYGKRPPGPTPGHPIGDIDSRTRRRRPASRGRAPSFRWTARMSSAATLSATTRCETRMPRPSWCTTTSTFRACMPTSRSTVARCSCATRPHPAAPSSLPPAPRPGPRSVRPQPNSSRDGLCGSVRGF